VATDTRSVVLAAPELRELTARVFRAAGSPDEIAAAVAASLVLANLRGVDSHGVMRVPEYLGYIRDGRVDPAATPTVTVEGPVVRVEGRRAFGQIAGREAALAASEQARSLGVSLAVVSNVKHVGRVGEIVEVCAAAGCIGIAFCNGGPPGGLVAPYGGGRRALSTNPLAYAFPVADRAPVVADFSTSTVAEGKVRLHRHAGKQVPAGWLIDSAGRPTTKPADLYDGGAILPAGGHKGYALGLLVEVLGGVLAGEGCASTGADPGNGVVLFVVDAGSEFAGGAAGAVAALEAVPPAVGFERVVVPGTPEEESGRRRLAEGIPIESEVWREIAEAARTVGVELATPGEERHDV
jgi:LDH2 family malate/lactate/ureidoglycolate dehydrogenase